MRRSPRVLIVWTVVALVALITARVVAGDLASLHHRARSLGPEVNVMLATGVIFHSAPSSLPPTCASSCAPRSTVATRRAAHRRRGRDACARRRVVARDVIRARDLAPLDRSGLDGLVPVGRRAVDVILKDGFRPPVGAVVDVFAAFDAASGPDRASATVVASGARVIGVEDEADSATGGGSSVTLLVTEGEVADVAYAGSTGTIVLALGRPSPSTDEQSASNVHSGKRQRFGASANHEVGVRGAMRSRRANLVLAFFVATAVLVAVPSVPRADAAANGWPHAAMGGFRHRRATASG